MRWLVLQIHMHLSWYYTYWLALSPGHSQLSMLQRVILKSLFNTSWPQVCASGTWSMTSNHTNIGVKSPLTRDSHYYVPCTSTCDGNQEIWSSKWGLDHLIHPLKLAWLLDLRFLATWLLDSSSKRMHIQVYTIGHAYLPFIRSVRDHNVRKN